MISFPVLRNFTSIALTACCAIGVSSAHALTYSLTDLGVLPGQKEGVSAPAAINSLGQVAGTSGASAFLYTKINKEPMQDIGGTPGGTSRAFGINATSLNAADGTSQVVGDSTFGMVQLVSHAALFNNGSATDLGTLKERGPYSRANGINAAGQVIGFSGETLDGARSRAFIVNTSSRASRMTDLGTLGGLYSQALAINDSGFVTGNAQTSPVTNQPDRSHAFVWHVTTGMLDLGTLDGDFSYGTAINASNHVVGYSTVNSFDDRIHAFLHNGDEMLDLGSLSGASLDYDYSFALGVNASDQVVGYSYLPSGQGEGSINTPLGPWSVAFVYSNGLMMNLNDMIGDASKTYRLDSAMAINDIGEIVAVAFDKSAGKFRAVLLTPEPEIGPENPTKVGPAKR